MPKRKGCKAEDNLGLCDEERIGICMEDDWA